MPDRPPAKQVHLYAVFASAAPLHPVIDRLRKEGIPEDRLAVFANRPIQVDLKSRSTHLVTIAVIAGLVGIGIGILLTAGTALLYPLMTGGKPIVAVPVVGLISYETMMLCAIVATFIGLVVPIVSNSRRMGPHGRLDGDQAGITVRLDAEDGRAIEMRQMFQETGATDVDLVQG